MTFNAKHLFLDTRFWFHNSRKIGDAENPISEAEAMFLLGASK